jgi:hypothetical protein
MVYDDDTDEPPHNDIKRSDRKIVDINDIPREVQDRIAELMELNRSWEPEDVFEQILEEGYDIELNDVYSVLYAIGWTF